MTYKYNGWQPAVLSYENKSLYILIILGRITVDTGTNVDFVNRECDSKRICLTCKTGKSSYSDDVDVVNRCLIR